MSMINDMLRDLDKRKAPELGNKVTSAQESMIEAQASIFPKIVLLVLLILMLACFVYFMFLEKTVKLTTAIENEISSNLNQEQTDTQAINHLVPVEENQTPILVSEEKLHSEQSLKEESQPEIAEHAIEEKAFKKQVQASTERASSTSASTKSTLTEQAAEKNLTKKNTTQESMPTSTVKQKLLTDDTIAKVQKPAQTINKSGVTLSPAALDQQMAKKALMLISQHKEIEAYRALYAFIGEHDEDMESRTVLATYLLNENRMAEVGDILLNAPLHKSPKLRQIKARWYVQQGKPNLALYTLNSDLPSVEKYPEYYILLAAYYQRYGSAKKTQEIYSILVEHDENVADWWAGLGLASDRNNELEKAVYAYQQALELSGLSAELLNFVEPRLIQLQASQTDSK